MACVFIDYSKAFDTIDHDILCKKLEYYGFGDDIIAWCRHYLSHRKQLVKNGEHLSNLADISCGVPQGSILGPLFFIIYANDIISLFSNEGPKILLYADDTVLYHSHIDAGILFRDLKNGMSKIWKWCKLNRLSINASKTKYMVTDPHKIKDRAQVHKVSRWDIQSLKMLSHITIWM